MRLVYLIYSIILFENCSAQKNTPIVYDTTDQIFKFINLSEIDTVSLWRYELNLGWKGHKNDTYPPIGQLSFFRVKPIVNYWNQIRFPYLRYNIYPAVESMAATKQSNYIKQISSCFPLRGGERMQIGNFIFVNADVCSGDIDKKANEICRPVVNYIMGLIDEKKTNSIRELVNQIQLEKGFLKFQ